MAQVTNKTKKDGTTSYQIRAYSGRTPATQHNTNSYISHCFYRNKAMLPVEQSIASLPRKHRLLKLATYNFTI